MCGIVGYVGDKFAVDVLIDGLSHLEYRGYDSSGVALMTENGINIFKAPGKLLNLIQKLRDEDEVKIINGKPICADGVKVINPSFDVTDHSLIKGIITEYGVFEPEELKENFS